MLTIKYCNDGNCYADNEALTSAKDLWENHVKSGYPMSTWYVSNEIMIIAFRMLIKRGTIPHDEIRFKFTRGGTMHLIKSDKDGNLDLYPPGFCDTMNNLLFDLV